MLHRATTKDRCPRGRPFSIPVCITTGFFACLLAVWSAGPVQAQPVPSSRAWDSLKVADYEANTSVPPVFGVGKTGTATATFFITFDADFPTEARNAFTRAAEIWESHIDSPVPIVVEATWDSLEEDVLGAAGTTTLYGNRPAFAVQETWYPVALANSIVGRDLDPGSADIQATFNREFDNWYFGLDGNPPQGTFDFVSVVLHELGHGLGFQGSFAYDDGETDNGNECPGPEGSGCWGDENTGTGELYPWIFDRFTEDAQDTPLLNTSIYPNNSATLGDVLQSGTVYFDGDFSRPVSEVPISLYAPDPFDPGSSYSHLDETVFPAGDPNSLMTPRIARSEAIHSPGAITCAMFQDVGWGLGESCIALISSGTSVDTFNADISGGEVVLAWFISNTAGLDRVEVQRRFFEDPFVTVDVLEGNEGAAQQPSYRIEDLQPGTYSFRLKLIYEDGSIAFSAARDVVVPLTEAYSLTEFYPNPIETTAKAALIVDEQQHVYAEAYDVAGRRVALIFNRTVLPDTRYDIDIQQADLSGSGVYFVRITGETFTTTRSFVFIGF